jgi:hypothetical protein
MSKNDWIQKAFDTKIQTIKHGQPITYKKIRVSLFTENPTHNFKKIDRNEQ